MKARIVRFHAFGGPEVLSLDEVEVGEPGPGEVRLRVGAFGLNRVEAMFRAGHYVPTTFPSRLGYEAAGTIEALGEGVTGWKVGDRVATLFGLPMMDWGTHGEALVYPASLLVPVPDGQSLTEAAASWMQYATAWALVECGHVKPGDVVAINAASSSVGLAAIQIALAHQAVPVAITRGRDKAPALEAAGAAHVIVSDEEDMTERLMAITGGAGADIVFDAVAGAPLAALLAATRPRGVVIVYGLLAGPTVELSLLPLIGSNLTLRGWSADDLIRQPEPCRRMVEWVGTRLADRRLVPIIDRTFPLEHVADAHRWLEANRQIGKIVVETRFAGE